MLAAARLSKPPFREAPILTSLIVTWNCRCRVWALTSRIRTLTTGFERQVLRYSPTSCCSRSRSFGCEPTQTILSVGTNDALCDDVVFIPLKHIFGTELIQVVCHTVSRPGPDFCNSPSNRYVQAHRDDQRLGGTSRVVVR